MNCAGSTTDLGEPKSPPGETVSEPADEAFLKRERSKTGKQYGHLSINDGRCTRKDGTHTKDDGFFRLGKSQVRLMVRIRKHQPRSSPKLDLQGC